MTGTVSVSVTDTHILIGYIKMKGVLHTTNIALSYTYNRNGMGGGGGRGSELTLASRGGCCWIGVCDHPGVSVGVGYNGDATA